MTQLSTAEMREYQTNQLAEAMKANEEALRRLSDVNRPESRRHDNFSKDKLRTQMKNPAASVKELRNLSRYLYYRSLPYRRLIWYNAGQIDLSARTVVPLINLTKQNDDKKILKSYYDTLNQLEYMNLRGEFLKMYLIAWREDTAFGIAYHDDKGFFILPLDGDYCKVIGMWPDGSLAFAYDMSWFTSREVFLEYYGEPFLSMWEDYKKDRINGKWQPVPQKQGICLKVNIDDPTFPIPPYVALFNSLIDLADLENIQAVKDELSIYKLLMLEIPLIDGAKAPDSWGVNPATAVKYLQRLQESVPEYVGLGISPVPVNAIEFDKDQANDVNQISKAVLNLYNTAGGAEMLNSGTISGTTAFLAAIKVDAELALGSLLPQTEVWLNTHMKFMISNPSRIRFLRVTPYTKDDFKRSLRDDATYGLPNRLAINSLNGYTELETLSMLHLEQDILNLDENMHPMQSSHTQSSSDATKPESEASDLTDEGEASRDKRDQL